MSLISIKRHEGHRKRIFERIEQFGTASLADHELLECLLFFPLPRVNTNEIAHDLLQEAGSLQRLPDLDDVKLKQVKGIGKRSALFFLLIFELFKRVTNDRREPQIRFDSFDKVSDFLMRRYAGLHEEQFCALFLDGKLRLLKFEVFSKGSVNAAGINPRAIAYAAARCGASCVIIAHNHPNGYSAASDEDLAITEATRQVLSAIDVSLIEHIIIGESACSPTMMSDIHCNGADSSALTGEFYTKFYKGKH
ncbi:MAG: DNA repair protein RadC [Clostridia bacterium]|nr:DNA repair protein RadC [Clostridia bacterium]